jgi:dCMP deaminase
VDNIYIIAKAINQLIKGYRSKIDTPTRIIIDSLKNPFEIMFFKERYSAFYNLAVYPEKECRKRHLKKKYKKENYENITNIDEIEYGDKNERTDFFKNNVHQCIQMSDLHLVYEKEAKKKSKKEAGKEAEKKAEKEAYEDMKAKVVIFYSLMLHPGLITPTHQERCMQIAYTAKYNSGCISRQVGAVITDENYSIKSVGWNTTPEGQTPCLLRNAEELLNLKEVNKEIYSAYEKANEFKKQFKKYYANKTKNIELEGLHCAYCFKAVQNSIIEGKNQVHTRSLHAEENAMLQLAKYGGQGIKGGYLFTTASPCELCAKKAYQLGIKKIYYIDTYKSISEEHVLDSGIHKPNLEQFRGAIGKSYHRFYEPFMPFKDEISIRIGIEIPDKLKETKRKLKETEEELKETKKELEKIKKLKHWKEK